MKIDLRVGDSLQVLKELEDNSVDSVVTDPPYGLKFMSKKWDYDVPTTELWKEVIRVLKPGGHLLSFSSSRTYHRMAVAVEDAGFEIRDQIMWVYGSGFPKSHNIGKSYDKKLGKVKKDAVDKTVEIGTSMFGIGTHPCTKCGKSLGGSSGNCQCPSEQYDNPYNGWGTALKPSHEPIVLARKPFKGTVVDNVIKHGTGGINIDKSRVESDEVVKGGGSKQNPNLNKDGAINSVQNSKTTKTEDHTEGRFPANFIHDGSDEVLELFPQTKGKGHWPDTKTTGGGESWGGKSEYKGTGPKDETGDNSAARFFYCAKVSKAERNVGLDANLPDVPKLSKEEQLERYGCKTDNYVQLINLEQQIAAGVKKEDLNVFAQGKSLANTHPTVKPIKLMSYLVNLITPEKGVVLDPFCGSGSTGMACKQEGFDFIGIDLDEDYIKITEARINSWKEEIRTHGR